MIKMILFLPILPFYLIFSALKINRVTPNSVITALFKLIAIFFVVLPAWVTIYFLLGLTASRYLGYVPDPIPISGTGSMHPTFPKGVKKTIQEQSRELVGKPLMYPYPNGLLLFEKRYFNYELQRSDIVEFENSQTREITQKQHGRTTGMVKRIIGLPQDILEIRDGAVYLNNQVLNEPYIARARSTFGGSTLAECHQFKIPEGKLFVMGDNRKVSGDSRYELGLISYQDVEHVMPLEKQKGIYDKNWRDTTGDLDQNSKIKLDKYQYLRLLNQKRKDAGVKILKYQTKLEQSAKLRGDIILRFDDFSYEATRSGYTMKKAMKDVSYSNIVWGEAPLQGYYEAGELIENQFEFPKSKKFLLHKDYEEFGMAEVEGEINGCPTQVIVQHYAGYIPPNYKKETVESWKSLLEKLTEVQPGWQGLKNYSDFYSKNSTNIDRINEIIATRITNIKGVVAKMESNLWLTPEEEAYLKQDVKLSEEQTSLAGKLNEK